MVRYRHRRQLKCLSLLIIQPIIVLAALIFPVGAVLAQTVFTDQVPTDENYSDSGGPYELGMTFSSTSAGNITAIRHWKAADDNATHVGRIWDANENQLTEVTFVDNMGSGWKEQALTSPLPIEANTTYVVSVNSGTAGVSGSYYSYGSGLPVTNGDLTGSQGMYGDPGSFPGNSSTFNYFRDIVFQAQTGVCISGEKSVSVNGSGGPFVRNSVTVDGGAVVPPENLNDLPMAFFGGEPVFYQFVVTNCGTTTLYNVRIDDCIDQRSVGEDGFLVSGANGNCVEDPRLIPPSRPVGDGQLEPGESVTLTSADFPNDPISSVDICEEFGPDRIDDIVRNDSEVEACTQDTNCGNGDPAFVSFDDLNLVQCKPPTENTAKLGDRVWEDLNGNGIQDCNDTNGNGIIGDEGDTGDECDAGVPNATVNLLAVDSNGQCNGQIAQVTTGSDGFYGFENLEPGGYCVEFVLPADFCGGFGGPTFTTPNVGGDAAKDSDADPETGLASGINLSAGQTDLTWDAGIYCSARLGDRVWNDLNSNGIQDCDSNDAIVGDATDVGDECASAGESGVPVRLYRGDENGGCDTSQVLATQTTGALSAQDNSPGFYFFTRLGANNSGDPLPPGYYCIEWTPPSGKTCTTPNNPQAPNERFDSDGVLQDGVCRTVEPVFVASRRANRTWDLGLVQPSAACNVEVDKKCAVTPPPTGDLTCSDHIVATTLRYTGPSIAGATVEFDPDKGPTVTYSGVDLVSGETVLTMAAENGFTVDARPNENELGAKTKIRINGVEEVIHTSCSTPYVAGQAAPLDNPTGNPSPNWFVVNFVDKDALNTIVQVSEPPQPQDNCMATLPQPQSCETLGKPKELVFEYTGAGCSASNNPQGGKAVCTSSDALDEPVTVRAAGNNNFSKDVYTVTGSPVAEGGTFTVSFNGADFKADSYIELMDSNGDTELNKIHTSCSQALALGDKFGSLTLVGFNGTSSEVEVIYTFDVKNPGSAPLSGLMVNDSVFGELASDLILAPGESTSYTRTKGLSETETNTVTVTQNEQPCGQDTVEVTVNSPAIPIAGKCDDLKPIDALVLEFDQNVAGKAISAVDQYRDKYDPNNPAKNFMKTYTDIADGDVVTFNGYAAAGAPNDVDLLLKFTDGSTATSQFHRSCSDKEMNDISDCGMPQGNGTDNNRGLNTWLLRDLLGKGKRLGCEGSPYAQ